MIAGAWRVAAGHARTRRQYLTGRRYMQAGRSSLRPAH